MNASQTQQDMNIAMYQWLMNYDEGIYMDIDLDEVLSHTFTTPPLTNAEALAWLNNN